MECLNDPDRCAELMQDELNKVFKMDDCLLESSVVRLLELPMDVILYPKFQLKTNIRNKPTDTPQVVETRLHEHYHQKFLACSKSE